jgi:hypothetical protein
VFDRSAYKTYALIQLAGHQATSNAKLRSLSAFLEEEISKRREASANDRSQQCAAYTDDRGENWYVH